MKPPTVDDVLSKKVLLTWFGKSVSLLLGTLAYNVFVIVVLQPVLSSWFPPLSGWEHVRSAFTGHSRWTYRDLMPYVGPTIWIVGNGLCFAMLNRKLSEARETVVEQNTPQEGGRGPLG